MTLPELLAEAIQAAREGRRVEARTMLLQVVEEDSHNEAAWIWLTGLVDDLEDKIIACENVLTLNPGNERVRAYLNQLIDKKKALQSLQTKPSPAHPVPSSLAVTQPPIPLVENDPRRQARQYESEGELEQARQVLIQQASVTKDSNEFDRIYKEIDRLEALQDENITYVSPTLSILRLSFGWPLLYLALALIHSGLNPIAHPSWYLWLGLPIVAVGGFLLSVAEVPARNPFWKAVFAEENAAGSGMARTSASIGGWILVIMPHVLLLAEALSRLQVFQIPPFPF